MVASGFGGPRVSDGPGVGASDWVGEGAMSGALDRFGAARARRVAAPWREILAGGFGFGGLSPGPECTTVERFSLVKASEPLSLCFSHFLRRLSCKFHHCRVLVRTCKLVLLLLYILSCCVLPKLATSSMM